MTNNEHISELIAELERLNAKREALYKSLCRAGVLSSPLEVPIYREIENASEEIRFRLSFNLPTILKALRVQVAADELRKAIPNAIANLRIMGADASDIPLARLMADQLSEKVSAYDAALQDTQEKE